MLAAGTNPGFFGSTKDLRIPSASSAEIETASSFVFTRSIL
ncbi:MAG TPA: hypothetical protein O0X23_03515 [Methanocorpusculum sp.]|nr:hypothetical protein [Methanocorpusculum sp.]